jgi:hypothetical protein
MPTFATRWQARASAARNRVAASKKVAANMQFLAAEFNRRRQVALVDSPAG